jgi:hypothetical protein
MQPPTNDHLPIPTGRFRREAVIVRSPGGHRTGMPHDDVLQHRSLRAGVGHSVHAL